MGLDKRKAVFCIWHKTLFCLSDFLPFLKLMTHLKGLAHQRCHSLYFLNLFVGGEVCKHFRE